jgi:putative hydrolase of the HAD superfamily
MMRKAGLFDLDNTLYGVEQYFLGVFKDISRYVARRHGIPQKRVYEALVRLWKGKTSMYPRLFDDVLDLLQLDGDSLQSLLKMFNEYSGTLEPYPDVIPTLQALREKDYKLGIITDGNVERQKRKIEKLRLKPLFDTVVYAKEAGSKLGASPFLAALEKLEVNSSDAFYVGDNPLLDFKGAREAGIKTIRVLRGEFAQVPRNEYIDFEIKKLDELFRVMEIRR